MILRAAGLLITTTLLATAIVWGRSHSQLTPTADSSIHWTSDQLLLTRSLTGAVPGIAADLAVLEVFNIYATSKENPFWRQQLYDQLRNAQAMDPWFRDTYRLTEGLLAYEARMMPEAVSLLSASEPWLQTAEPLAMAAFIADKELNNRPMAIDLAKRAIAKPDVSGLTIAFAARLIKNENGCSVALAFLSSRLQTLPERYHQGIVRRIKQLRESEECSETIGQSPSNLENPNNK